jgi:hypothetical protein
VQSLKPADGRHTLDGHDARFEDTWTKLRAWELLEFDVSVGGLFASDVEGCLLIKFYSSTFSASFFLTATCSSDGIWTSCSLSHCRVMTG